MKSYKERTIQACKDLAYKYRHPKGKTFMNFGACPLCNIYMRTLESGNCRGCFMAFGDCALDVGCGRFKTFKNVENSFGFGVAIENDPPDAFIKRAIFFEQMAEELKVFPAEQFTKRFWKPFNIDLNR